MIHADGGHLAIGGGGHAGCVVYATRDDGTFVRLVDPYQPEDEPVEVVAGDEPGT